MGQPWGGVGCLRWKFLSGKGGTGKGHEVAIKGRTATGTLACYYGPTVSSDEGEQVTKDAGCARKRKETRGMT